jgi:methyl-accepting chemotaxis protein
MNWIKKLKIADRFYLFIGSSTLLIFVVFALYLNNNVSNTVSKNYLDAIDENVLNVETMLQLEIVSQREKTIVGGNLAMNYFENMGTLRMHNDLLKVGDTELRRWTWDNREIQNNFELVDAISKLGPETVTIFQKFEKGYIRISTNVITAGGERATGTYIDWDSPVVQAIEKGERFQGRAWVVDRWYVTDYQPIVVNNEIRGILYVGNTEVNYGTLSRYFKTKKYFGSGFPFIVNSDGVLTAHPEKQGENVAESLWFNSITEQKNGILNHDEDGNEKTQYFRFFEDIDSYIVVEWYSSDFEAVSNAIGRIFAIASVVAVIILLLVVFLLVRSLNGNLEGITTKMRSAVASILDGDLKSRASSEGINFEFAPIVNGLNDVVDAMVKPLNMAANNISRISQGDIPPVITDEYKGEFKRD